MLCYSQDAHARIQVADLDIMITHRDAEPQVALMTPIFKNIILILAQGPMIATVINRISYDFVTSSCCAGNLEASTNTMRQIAKTINIAILNENT